MSVGLMGDFVLCARSASFLEAFHRIGLVPNCGSKLVPATAHLAGASDRTVAPRRDAAGGNRPRLVNRVYE